MGENIQRIDEVKDHKKQWQGEFLPESRIERMPYKSLLSKISDLQQTDDCHVFHPLLFFEGYNYLLHIYAPPL